MQDLLKTAAFINGQWQKTARTFPVFNPYSGQLIAEVADVGAEETEQAIAAAAIAFEEWRQWTATERSAVLRRWYDLQLLHQEALATLLTMEQGKPLAEAKSEILYGASFIEWFAEEGKRAYGDVIPAQLRNKRLLTLKQPIGVVAAITPWNFPHAMITRKVAPALAVGCTVVVKPAEDTPLTALALAALAQEAGFPPGVFNVLPSNRPKEVGAVLTASPVVRKLSFTGSTAVGKILMQQCAATVKKLSLELGGNAPFIVFEDADVAAAVEGAIAAKYRNAGQTCVCANRILVQSSIYDAFMQAFRPAVAALRLGNGLEAGTDIGPLINQKALQKVQQLLADAQAKGGQLAQTKAYAPEQGLCYPASIIEDVRPDMAISQEEIFGPIAPIYRFETEQEAIKLANATPYGLAAYFYGRDHARIWRVAEALEYGMVGINTGLISTTLAPFGGIKESGFGREGSKYGLADYLNIKYLCWEV